MANIRSFQLQPMDNVATMLEDGLAGPVQVLGPDAHILQLLEPARLGHKIAIRNIARGEPILKYGIAIGHATADIRAGQWVHLHNFASQFDERSQTLDVHTGAVTDTKYE